MKNNKYTVEQIINILNKVDVMVAGGTTIAQAVREAGVSEQSYYKWRKQYHGMSVSDAKRLKELEKENARLKKIVAELSLDNNILKDTIEGKF